MTIDELDASSRKLASDSSVTVTTLGESRLGRPIEMITIGEGDRDALVVGVPHPNEPAGALTVERMITLLLHDAPQRRGYRWHFIKAIDPEGLRLNAGWLKKPRTIAHYLENYFRPALDRQPETTFPLDIPDVHFDQSTPENQAWQSAFAVTRPCLHASLHHCDYGGVFYSLSRALPAVLDELELAAVSSGLGINELEGDVMVVDRWTASVSRYPSVPELVANAKASGASWAYPWTVGEMSPGFGESRYGTFTLVPEVPLWNSAALHDHSPSGVTRKTQQSMLREIVVRACETALRHAPELASSAATPDEEECLRALQEGLKMMPASPAEVASAATDDNAVLSSREFELAHTHHVLTTLRTYGLLLRAAALILSRHEDDVAALRTRREVREALRREIAAIEARTALIPVPLETITGLQMHAIFRCADALAHR